jgi:serine/threonine protein kinase
VDDVRPIAGEEIVEILSIGMAFVTFVAKTRGGASSVCKRVRLAAVGDEAGAQLVREAEALARLDGHGAPRLLAAGEDELGPFVSMELVRGRRIASWEDARPAFQALAAVHERGVVHGDISPANLIIGTGAAWLVDFCSATRLAKTFNGTIAFTAPERARGEEIDERADVFSMAASIVSGATGVAARSFGDLPQGAQLALAGENPLDAAFVALAPEALRDCLAFERHTRPRDAAAVLTRLS